MDWNYLQPVEIFFGNGRIERIGELAEKLGCKKGSL